MYRHDLLVRYAFLLLSTVLLSPALLAAEQIKGVSYFAEPLTVEAVPGKQRHLLAVLPQPKISAPVYALRGMIRYDGVEGDAYLQMNNDFGDTGVFFTKGVFAGVDLLFGFNICGRKILLRFATGLSAVSMIRPIDCCHDCDSVF